MFKHYTVLKEELTDSVLNDLSGIYVDGTLGGGGHTLALSEKLSKKAKIIAIDQDKYAFNLAKKKFEQDDRILVIHENFKNLKKILKELNISKINGLILDLGFSSPQIDNPDRGFSYMNDGYLDMRMNTDDKKTAHFIVNNYSFLDLKNVLIKYGEEKNASRICNEIIESRKTKEINTTFELVDVIERALPMAVKRKNKGHNAKKTFQALRIEVNDELKILDQILNEAFEFLKPGGRIGIISFHSLEDKMVKHKFIKLSKVDSTLKKLPEIPQELLPKGRIIFKSITPTEEELIENSRSKSARLRVLERI